MTTGIFMAAANLFQSVSLSQFFIFFLYIMVGGGVYYALKTYLPKMAEAKMKSIEEEQKRTVIMEDGLGELKSISQANSAAITGFNQTMLMLNQTFEKVSDKLYSHDEKSDNICAQIIEVKDELEALKHVSPNEDTMLRIHNRIDNIDQNGADKNDVGIIISKLDQIQDAVSEIRGSLR